MGVNREDEIERCFSRKSFVDAEPECSCLRQLALHESSLESRPLKDFLHVFWIGA